MLARENALSRRRLLLSALALLPAGRPLRGQKDTTFTADVKVVNLFATVRDKQGRIVRDLNKDDFALEEDGRPQAIRYFSQESDLPLTLGLLADTSISQRRVLGQERSASHRFLDQMLREDKDLAFVIHFDREVELLQDLTSSRKKLEEALAQLELPRLPSMRSSQRPPQRPTSGGRRGGGGTSLFDAVLLASDELMKKQAGRKSLIVLSDGVDVGSRVSLTSAIESAQRADTLVYSILFADPDAYGRSFGGYPGRGMGRRGGGFPPRGRYPEVRPDGKKILQRLSKETGGGFFEVSKKQPIDKIYDQIQEELRNQYSLGFTPDKTDTVAGYRKIRLTVKQPELVIQTRDGYFAGP